MTTILIILVILLFQGISTPVSARDNLTREATFESGEPNNGWSGTNKDTDTMRSVTITSNEARRGNRSVMADRKRGTNRSEVSDRVKGRAPLHKRVMYGWSLKVDKNTNGNGRLIVSQIHHHQAGNKDNQWVRTANFIFRHDRKKGKFTLRHIYQINHPHHIRKDVYKDLCKAQYRKWYDFVIEAKWTWKNDGYVKIWCNGQLVYDHEGPTYFDYGDDTLGPYWKAGAYTDKTPAEVYVDEYRMGNSRATYADVDPAGKDKPEPPSEPPPSPDLPVLEMEPQQTATCDRSVLQLSQVDSKYLIECGKEK